MTAPVGTRIDSAHGPVHTGSGDQHNHIHPPGGPPCPRELIRIAAADRRWLCRRFVRPRNLGRAAERLTEPGATVLLGGEAGVGRRAAGIVLLHELPGRAGVFENLPIGPRDGRPDHGPDDRLLLDLSAAAADDRPAALEALDVHRSAAERTGARLVVVLSPEVERVLAPELRHQAVELGRPRGRAVLARHLRADEVPHRPEDLERPELPLLAELLATAPMRDIARLARAVGGTGGHGRPGAAFADRLAAALAEVTDHSDEVARQVGEVTDVRARALLLAGAMLEGAPVDAVVAGADRLLRLLGGSPGEESALAGPDLRARFEALRMRRTRDGRTGFAQSAYGRAVRSHFWTWFPGLREHLRDWTAEAVRLPGLGPAERRELALRFAEQARAAGRPDDLRVLAEQWGGRLPAEAALLREYGPPDAVTARQGPVVTGRSVSGRPQSDQEPS
ncbi:hypothetical protein ACFV1L_14755 [Kitasatospora sp. NPDC059646]|uniref:hypothetical protein n=1 Tax=Kitasatospora sp. NPDC059646 TaxID=3346893 RepID=UPI003687CF0E